MTPWTALVMKNYIQISEDLKGLISNLLEFSTFFFCEKISVKYQSRSL